MKTLLTLSLMTLSTLAQASSYQVECASADASVRVTQGHGDNFVQVTVRDWENNKDTVIRDEEGRLEARSLSTQVIRKEGSEGQCRDGISAPWSRETTVQEFEIKMADGSRFPEYTLNVSEDRLTVKALLVCEENVANIEPCYE